MVGPGPWNVGVGVVLQFDGGRLCVRFCFGEGPSRLCALGECGGEEGGEWVREKGVYFGGVQHWLVGGRGLFGIHLGASNDDSDGGNRLTLRVLSRMSTTTLCM
jgi:hypothetical protein